MKTCTKHFVRRSTHFTMCAVLAISLGQAAHSEQAAKGTFLNPPKAGERITPYVGSVVCRKEIDAMSMASSGFFAPSCETLTADTNIVAESIEQRDAGTNRGLVWMVRTTYKGKPAWVPIPWHDWG